jgi:hypothetical protein
MLIVPTGLLPNACGTPAERQPMPADASRTPADACGRQPDASRCLPDAMKPGIHCVRTHWIRGFMAFQLAWRTGNVMLVVPVCPESCFLGRATRSRPIG